MSCLRCPIAPALFSHGLNLTQAIGAAFGVALAEILGSAEFAEPLTYHHAVRLQPSEALPQGHIVANGAIESQGHACKSVANIWLSQPQRRFRRVAFLSPAQKLLASAAVPPLYSRSGEAVGISGGPARLFGSCPPVLETILDTVGMGDRSLAASLRAVPAACAPDGSACSPHGRDEVRAMGGQGFPTAPALGRCAESIFQQPLLTQPKRACESKCGQVLRRTSFRIFRAEIHFSFAYSAFAAMRMGMSGSASFQSVRKS